MMNTDFRKQLEQLPREDLLEILADQDDADGRTVIEERLTNQVERIEWVFRNRLQHLSWPDGRQITERPLTNEELALLIDEPFVPSKELLKEGFNIQDQKTLHIAGDPVLWAKHYLGAKPRAYQVLMLRHPSNRKVLRAGRRLGKALHIDTPIPTPFGWVTMKELEIGDQVFDEYGKPCNVTDVTDVQWDRDCYRVSFSDGNHLIADADHLWTVDTKQSRKARSRAKNPQSGPVTLTTREMIDNLYVWCGDKFEVNYSIDNTQAVQYEEKTLPIDPWLFGLWLADGNGNDGVITIGEEDQPEVLERMRSKGIEAIQVPSAPLAFRIQGLWKKLNDLTILRKYRSVRPSGSVREDNLQHKFIPVEYLQASVFQRLELLKGLMDGDGTAYKNGNVEFSVCNKALATDTLELIESLGIRATFKESEATLYGEVVGTRYRINFTPWFSVFHLRRKVERQHLSDGPSARQRCRYIVAIEKVDSVPVKCISVDSPNSMYLAGKNFIPTHNSWTMSCLMLHYAFTHNNGRVIVVAPMKSQVELLYKEVLGLAGKSEIVQQAISRSVTSPQFTVEFTNGSTIRFFTSGVRSGGKADVVRGQEAHIIVLDEVDYMHNDDLESLYAMLQKTAEGQIEKQMIGASTPSGRRDTFWDWCNSPNIWKEFWFPSYVNPFFSQQSEDELRSHYTEMGYRHEVEADWGEDSEGVYPRKYVDQAFNVALTVVGDHSDANVVKRQSDWKYVPVIQDTKSFFTIGVDWDKYGAGTNIVVLEVCDHDYDDPRFRNKIRLYHREEIAKDEFTLTNAVDRIIELNGILQPRHIYIDRGYGDVQAEMLHKYGIEHPETQLRKRVKGIQFAQSIKIRDPGTKEMVTKDVKPFMVENLRRHLERNEIFFPSSDDVLYLQLISYIVSRTSVYGRPIFEATGKSGDHIHDALILALYAVEENYGDLLKLRRARKGKSISSEAFLPTFYLSDEVGEKEKELDVVEKVWGSVSEAPITIRRGMSVKLGRSTNGKKRIRRNMF